MVNVFATFTAENMVLLIFAPIIIVYYLVTIFLIRCFIKLITITGFTRLTYFLTFGVAVFVLLVKSLLNLLPT